MLVLLGAYYWVHMLRSLPDLPDQLLFEQLGGAKCTDFRIPFRMGKLLAECAGCYGSGTRGGSGIGPGRRVSVEKDGGTDPCHGEIGAPPRRHTRVLTCIWLSRPPRCVSSSPTGPPCRALLALVISSAAR